MRILLLFCLSLCVCTGVSALRPSRLTPGAQPVVVVDTIYSVSCAGASNGGIFLSVQGQAPFTFEWSNGYKEQNLLDVPAGHYSCTVTDADGNEVTLTELIVEEPLPLTINLVALQPITCIHPTGSISVSGSGGTPGYQYSWNNGQTGLLATGLQAGAYTVYLTDANDCLATATFTIMENLAPPSANAGPSLWVLCSNTPTQLQGSGSTGPQFIYNWLADDGGRLAGGGNTLTPDVDHTGTYVLVVTNTINGCTATDATTVSSQYQSPEALVEGGTLTCAVNQVALQADFDTLHTTFSWQGPGGFASTLPHPVVTTPGNYLFTLADTLTGCFTLATATVDLDTLHPSVTAGASGTISCATPTVALMAWPTPGGAYLQWTGPNNFVSNSPQPYVSLAGTYAVIATHPQNGCTASWAVNVTGNTTPPSVLAAASGPLTCNSPTVLLSGSVSPSNAGILWSGPNGFLSNQLNVSVSVAGAYTLRATNNQNGCTATATVTVVQNTAKPDLTVTGGSITCATPQVTLQANSSTPGLTYQWTGPNGFNATQQSPVVSTSGYYAVTVVNPANGCTNSAGVSVGINLTVPILLVSTATITCANPVAHPTASSYTPGATFTWTGPGGYTATGSSPAVTQPGFYTATATNPINGCTSAATVQITQNTQAPIVNPGEPQTFSCTGAPLLLSAAGSSTGAAYQWTTWNGQILSGANSLNPWVGSPGVYTLQVTSFQSGCISIDSVEIYPPVPVNAGISQIIPVSCNGGANGSATVSVAGGTPPFSYAWSNGSATPTANGLSAGLYTVTVTDSKSCTDVEVVLINQPPALQASASATPQTQYNVNNGTATVTYSGGTSPYSVLWSNNAVTGTIFNLAPGAYTVTVTDNKGCTIVRTVQVNAVNCTLGGSIAATQIACSGTASGSATMNPSGGISPFQYIWSNGAQTKTISNLGPGAYTVTATDASGCTLVQSVQITSPPVLTLNLVNVEHVPCPTSNTGLLAAGVSGGTAPYVFAWSNGASSATITGLSPGTYTLTVSDAKGCTKTLNGSININDQNPPQLILKNATVTLNATGMVALSAALFDNGSFDAECSITSWTIAPATAACSQLGALTVTLTATDVNGNSASGTAVATVTDNIAPSLFCPENITVGYCAAIVNFPAPQASDNCGVPPGLIEQIAGRPSGSQFPVGQTEQVFQCRDAAGNTATCRFEVWVADEPTGTITPIPASCSGLCDGSAVFEPAGGGPTLVQWSNGQNGFFTSGFCPGEQTAIVTDVHGCVSEQSFTIPVANSGSFEITAFTAPASCAAACDGGSNLTIGGGASPYLIQWNTGQQGYVAANLCPGQYQATVTDANGCSQVQPVQIGVLDNVAPTLTCPANITTSWCAAAVAYNPPVAQDNCPVDPQHLVQLSGLPSGAAFPQGVSTQVFQYTDDSGNSGQCSFTVTVLEPASVDIDAFDVRCAGLCNGNAVAFTSGGYGPFMLSWSNGQNGPEINNLCPGTYTLTIADAAGCTQTRQMNIGQPLPLDLELAHVQHDAGNSGSGSIDIIVNGGTAPYAFQWTSNEQPFADVQNPSGLFAGLYQVVVTDAQGCTLASMVITIDNTVAVHEAGWANDLRLYPNPAHATTQIILPEAPNNQVVLQLFDSAGRPTLQIPWPERATQLDIDLSVLPAGLWLVRLQSADGAHAIRKLVIQR